MEPLIGKIIDTIDYFSTDGAYDEVVNHSPTTVNVVIPPKSNAVLNDKSVPQRHNNLIEISSRARMIWQKQRAMLDCEVINKMTSLGMPGSYRSAQILKKPKW